MGKFLDLASLTMREVVGPAAASAGGEGVVVCLFISLFVYGEGVLLVWRDEDVVGCLGMIWRYGGR